MDNSHCISSPNLPRLGQSQPQSGISLYSAKMAKKQSEEELQKIQNRITLLKTEQMKLTKKIQRSDQKAFELYTAKKIYNENKEIKLKEKLEATPPFTYPIHIKQQEVLQKIKETGKFNRHHEAQISRIANKDQVDQAKVQQKKNLVELRFRAQDIKDKEISSAYLISQKLKDRREKIRSDVFHEADQVLYEKQTYDLTIKQLEQDELTALKSLQVTQTKHRNISEKLHFAHQLSSKQFYSKYLSNSVLGDKSQMLSEDKQMEPLSMRLPVELKKLYPTNINSNNKKTIKQDKQSKIQHPILQGVKSQQNSQQIISVYLPKDKEDSSSKVSRQEVNNKSQQLDARSQNKSKSREIKKSISKDKSKEHKIDNSENILVQSKIEEIAIKPQSKEQLNTNEKETHDQETLTIEALLIESQAQETISKETNEHTEKEPVAGDRLTNDTHAQDIVNKDGEPSNDVSSIAKETVVAEETPAQENVLNETIAKDPIAIEDNDKENGTSEGKKPDQVNDEEGNPEESKPEEKVE